MTEVTPTASHSCWLIINTWHLDPSCSRRWMLISGWSSKDSDPIFFSQRNKAV